MRSRSMRHWCAVLLLAGCGTPLAGGDSELETRQAAATSQEAKAAPARGKARRPKKNPDVQRYATGYRDPTPEELKRYGHRPEALTGVRPTPLAVERVRRHLAGKHAAAAMTSIEAQAVPAGADVATAPSGATLSMAAAPAAATATATVAATAVGTESLPGAVDNSLLPSFPEIRSQEGLGSCVTFAVGYYQYTHELGLLAGWNNKNADNTTKVSPKWLYNLVNGGYDGGTWDGSVYSILMQHGALTWAQFPYVGDPSNPVNYREWPRGAATWRSALKYKALSWTSVPTPNTPDAMLQVKNLLLNGHVLTFATQVFGWEYDTLDDDPSTTADDGFAGQRICSQVDGYGGGHEMTVVGYNDDLWIDLNGNGQVDSGEKGAFKIANSWGDWWENAGFVWLSYDALYDVSRVAGGPAGDLRHAAFWGLSTVTPRIDYQPALVAELTLTATQRDDLYLQVATTEPDRKSVQFFPWTPPAFSYNGGAYSFDGQELTYPQTATFALDLTDLAFSYGDLRYQITANNWGTFPVGLSGVTLVDTLKSGLRTASTEPPVNVPPSTPAQAQGVRYVFRDPARVPALTIAPSTALAFGDVAVGNAFEQVVTLRNTGTGDVVITSLRPTNALFFSPTSLPLRIQPGQSSQVAVQFGPASSQSETGSVAVRNTSANLSGASLSVNGTGTSSNASAPFLVYISAQDALTDNSIGMRIELRSQAPMPARLSNYKVVYFFKDPAVDMGGVVWDTYYTSGPAVTANVRRVFTARTSGLRSADTALELTFPEGTVIYPGTSVIFQGSLHRPDYTWYPDENDDWSRYARRDGLAESVVVQDIASKAVMFGSAAENPAGAAQLALTPDAVGTTDPMATYVAADTSWLYTSISFEIRRPNGTQAGYTYWTGISQVGPQSQPLSMTYLQPGRYTLLLKKGVEVVDYVEFTKL